MATAVALTRGTQRVLPTAVERFREGLNAVRSMKVVSFTGTKLKVYYFSITASGVYGPATSAYSVQMAFAGVNEPETNAPRAAKDRLMVRCSCAAYYFWFSYANKAVKAHYGTKFPIYVRKTPPPPKGYPYKNPGNIPGLCKHQLLALSSLTKTGAVK